MGRGIVINGESLVLVKGPQGSLIASITELGLAETQLKINIQPKFKDVNVEAWGEAPVDVQRMNCIATVSMNLIQFDPAVVRECVRLAMGGSVPGTDGSTSRAGALLGNGLPRFAAGNSFIGLNIASPVGQLPWNFLYSYLKGPIGDWPLGAEKTVLSLQWMAIPYTADPWNAGNGASDNFVFSHVLDT